MNEKTTMSGQKAILNRHGELPSKVEVDGCGVMQHHHNNKPALVTGASPD